MSESEQHLGDPSLREGLTASSCCRFCPKSGESSALGRTVSVGCSGSLAILPSSDTLDPDDLTQDPSSPASRPESVHSRWLHGNTLSWTPECGCCRLGGKLRCGFGESVARRVRARSRQPRLQTRRRHLDPRPAAARRSPQLWAAKPSSTRCPPQLV